MIVDSCRCVQKDAKQTTERAYMESRFLISDECVSSLMGLLDRLRGKKEVREEGAERVDSGTQGSSSGQQAKKIKRYTSDGKPVYE